MTGTLNGNMINGPINIVRMEGIVHGIKKIIYLFFDYHAPIIEQTRCPDYTSLDLYQYFAINLANTKNIIDFMFETPISYTMIPDSLRKEKYIDQVTHYFNSKFNEYKIKKKKNEKVNIRFHYIDIREDYSISVEDYVDDIYDYVESMKNNYRIFNANTVDKIKNNLEKITDGLNKWHSLLFDDVPKIEGSMLKFIKKIRYKYADPKILDQFHDIYNYTDELFKISFDAIKKMKDHLDNNIDMMKAIKKNKLVYSIHSNMYFWGYQGLDYTYFAVELEKIMIVLYRSVLSIFVNLVDLFFLRRFLDKDYIDHAIVYTGGAHSINYIQHLLTKHNFKITHASYSLEKNMDKLNDHLRKFTNPADMLEYEKNLFIPYLVQCSSIVGFPKDFN